MPEEHAHSRAAEAATMSAHRLALALGITLAFVVFEALAGIFANSLALLTDAAHNVTDVIALGLSWYAIRLTTRPASAGKTFGYHRAGILVALINSTTLVVISLGIFYEAYQRLLSPPQVEANVLIVVAAIAFIVNAGTALMVKRGSDSDLNMRSAFVHLSTDAISTFAAILAGIVIKFTGWEIIDPLVSILIGALILRSAWGIIRDTVDILLENTPRDLDMSLLVRDLLRIEGVQGVHDLHVWSISQNMRAFSAHILTEDLKISAGAQIQQKVNEVLLHDYEIGHATLQLECQGCEPDLLYCDLGETNGHAHSQETVKVPSG
jgi:cobalt-zinc-cadmium efflux system protein